jgi:hypothetical protein
LVYYFLQEFIARVEYLQDIWLYFVLLVLALRCCQHLDLAHPLGTTERSAEEDQASGRGEYARPFAFVVTGV